MTSGPLPAEQVIDVFLSHETHKELSARYGISITCVNNIKRGKRYGRFTALLRDPATINAFLMTMAAWPGDIVRT